MNKPTYPEVIPMVWDLYDTEHGACGGCLHIVLDDDNVLDDHVDYCINYARENGCKGCEELALIIRQMSKTQRLKLAKHAYDRKYRKVQE